jgi:SagB-type dehydrogenase family enzyme
VNPSRRSAIGWLLALLVVTSCASEAPRELRSSTTRFSQIVALPTPDTTGTVPLEQALSRRRSARTFSSRPLPLAMLGQLLWAGQGVTSTDGKRTAPSAGALYPIELYVVTGRRVLHYLPEGHRVQVRSDIDHRSALRDAAFGQSAVSDAPSVIVVAAVPARTGAKYGARADAFVTLEAGHVTQNILLEATAHALAAVPVGGVDPTRVRRALALPPDNIVFYLVPVGNPK